MGSRRMDIKQAGSRPSRAASLFIRQHINYVPYGTNHIFHVDRKIGKFSLNRVLTLSCNRVIMFA